MQGYGDQAMLFYASCHIEISQVEGLLEVNCVCYGETEEFGEPPYELSFCSEIEVDDLDDYVYRCFILFQGLIEAAVNKNNPAWEPTEAAELLFSLIESVSEGTDFA